MISYIFWNDVYMVYIFKNVWFFWLWFKTLSNGEASLPKFRGILSTASLPLLPGLFKHEIVIPVIVPSMSQWEFVKHY